MKIVPPVKYKNNSFLSTDGVGKNMIYDSAPDPFSSSEDGMEEMKT